MHRRPIGRIAAGLLTCLVAACGGGSSDEPDATGTTTSTAPSVVTTAAPGEAAVDLRFTGTYVLQIKDEHGACSGTGAGAFAFSMTGDDVDGIGEEFKVEQAGGGSVSWEIDSTNSYDGGSGTTFSADGKTATLDEDLERVGGASGAAPRPEHVSGTITCP